MDISKISNEEKQKYIEYMLGNQSLEKALRNWKKQKDCAESILEIVDALVDRAQANGGMIVAVNCPEIPIGVEYVDFLTLDKKYNMQWVEDEDNLRYVMVFTSKERFQECNDVSGIVVFMDDLFATIEQRNDLEGIMINLEKEEVILDKVMLRVVIWLMEH